MPLLNEESLKPKSYDAHESHQYYNNIIRVITKTQGKNLIVVILVKFTGKTLK